MTGTTWALLFSPILLWTVNRGIIEREERYLEERFGGAYREDKMCVRRWI